MDPTAYWWRIITGSGTPVNHLMFQSSATTEAVPISAIGSDSVIYQRGPEGDDGDVPGQ